ncbi:MAG: hypothetical protein ABSH20_04330 [Tepidisphaeraceae bacterium]|jgi:hypothetical protein
MSAVEIVSIVVDALNRLGVDYMLVGSFSSNLYGIPRMTKDADFLVQLGEATVGQIVAACGPGFSLDPQITFETITGTTRYRVQHPASDFIIEFFELSSDSHDRKRFARRRQVAFAGRMASVPAPEDVIITKLRWSKGGNRRKDVEDVENVLAVQVDALDLAYIRQWADQHGTRELFEKLLASAR